MLTGEDCGMLRDEAGEGLMVHVVFDFIIAGERGAGDCCKAQSSRAKKFRLKSRSLEE